MKCRLLLIVLVAASWSGAMAQSQEPQSTGDGGSTVQPHATPAPALVGGYLTPEGQDEESDAGDRWPAQRNIVPAVVGGYGPSLAIGEEMERSNYVRGGLTVQGTYDDNPYASSGSSNSSASNYAISIFPQIALDQSRSRVRWLLNYAGGFTFNQKLTQQNQTSQNFGFDLQYRVSPHVTARVTEAILLTAGLFGPVNSFNGSAPGVPQGSNTFVLTPLSKQFATVTRGEIGYQFSATDVVGASGGFHTLQFRDVAPGNSLLDTRAESGAGYFMHRVTPKNWLGASYSFEHLGYPGSIDDTIVHSVIAFDTYKPRPSMTLSFFGGPQYSENKFPTTSVPPQTGAQNSWSEAGGASFGWTSLRTSADVAYTYRIADGGGVQSTVQVSSISGSLRRQFSNRTSVGFLASYATNDALSPAAAGTSSANTKYASAGFSATHRLGENCFVQAGYTRQNQQAAGASALGSSVHRDSVIASFSYQFARPWGQ
jgi:hypothetical protein